MVVACGALLLDVDGLLLLLVVARLLLLLGLLAVVLRRLLLGIVGLLRWLLVVLLGIRVLLWVSSGGAKVTRGWCTSRALVLFYVQLLVSSGGRKNALLSER